MKQDKLTRIAYKPKTTVSNENDLKWSDMLESTPDCCEQLKKTTREIIVDNNNSYVVNIVISKIGQPGYLSLS